MTAVGGDRPEGRTSLHARAVAALRSLARTPFVRDVATMQAGQVFALGCGFVSSVVIARLLGIDGFGRYAIVLSFAGAIELFTDLGQWYTALTFLGKALGRGSRDDVRKVLHYYVLLSVGSSAILALLIPVLPTLAGWIYKDQGIGRLAQLVLLASIFDPVPTFMVTVLQSVREIRALTVFENGNSLFQLLVSVLFLALGYGITGVLVASLTASVTFTLVTVWLYPRMRRTYRLPGFAEIVATRGFGHVWEYWRQGLWIMLNKNLGGLNPTGFLFALSLIAPAPVVGLVRLAFRLASLPATVGLSSVSRLASSVLPTIAGRSRDELRHSVGRLVRHAFAFHAVITLGAAVGVPLLLPYVYGRSFEPAVYPFLVILVLQLSLPIHAIATPILRVASRIRVSVFINIAAALTCAVTFVALRTLVSPMQTLYVILVLYYVIVAFVAKPAWHAIQAV